MNVEVIRRRARIMGIRTGRMKKAEIIRAIQVREGYTPCFGTVGRSCKELSCCFRADCLTKSARA